jgi:hypothetical protein
MKLSANGIARERMESSASRVQMSRTNEAERDSVRKESSAQLGPRSTESQEWKHMAYFGIKISISYLPHRQLAKELDTRLDLFFA